MKRLLFTFAAVVVAISGSASARQSKDALDAVQFDGVMADGVLKDSHETRRTWLDQNPVPAKEYWKAWDCKGQPCDSKWQANIRAKAALVPRSEKDPKPVSGTSSSSR